MSTAVVSDEWSVLMIFSNCVSVPQRKVPDQDVAQGSYIALPLTLLLLLAAYNHEKVLCSHHELLHRSEALASRVRPRLCSAGDPPPVAGGQSHPGREDHGPSQRRRRRAGGRQTSGQETESQAYMNPQPDLETSTRHLRLQPGRTADSLRVHAG